MRDTAFIEERLYWGRYRINAAIPGRPQGVLVPSCLVCARPHRRGCPRSVPTFNLLVQREYERPQSRYLLDRLTHSTR